MYYIIFGSKMQVPTQVDYIFIQNTMHQRSTTSNAAEVDTVDITLASSWRQKVDTRDTPRG
jgi:hypothetical protein